MAITASGNVNMLSALPIQSVTVLEPYEKPTPIVTEHPKDDDGIIRSASFTALVGLTKGAPLGELKRTFSDNVLSSPAQHPTKVSPSMQNANVELFRRASRKTRKRMSVVGIGRDLESVKIGVRNRSSTEGESQSKDTARTVSGTLRNFARKSWMTTSRAQSPSNKDDTLLRRIRSRSPKKQPSVSNTPIAVPAPVASRAPSRSSNSIEDDGDVSKAVRRTEPRPATPKARSLRDINSRNQSATSLPRLSRQSSRTSSGSGGSGDAMYLEIPGSHVPPVPNSTCSDKLSGVSIETSRKKDPLWTAFRSIEGEWSNFQAKTSLQKAKSVRGVLLPFFSRHANDPSNRFLRAEDLDRRIVILNKWWSGLLELLSGRNHQSISATDRPAFLEAILEIMLRPEWRLPPFQNHSIPSVLKGNSLPESEEADFILESIHQNIRNMFVQNLLSQMAFVVDKLSMRSAPASLVLFGGKTCACAFFYCPGVADILIRLWHIPAGVLRRIFSEYGALHSTTSGSTSSELGYSFPPPVRSLCFSSQAGLARYIQPKALRPAGSESIRWYGPWVNRWIGRDSDLFFVFIKQYHLLVCEFHPTILSQPDRLSIPGLAPIHAQLLIVLESTLYRHVGHFTSETYTVGDTADAMVPLPMSIPNATRTMADNRLVMLLRDVANDTNVAHANVCSLMVESFELIMKAATRKLSMYNNDAAFVLCDLIEEVLPIFVRYENMNEDTHPLDWKFWMEVLRQLIRSETCMTQIRVIALLYSVWNLIISNRDRMRDLILGWVLTPQQFNQLFNHWSPMVRHYYYRLLCWRVARCEGEAMELELEIFQTLASRLNTSWAHHQYLVAEAEMRAISPPSSNPCSPAPGRSLIIVRTDTEPASPLQFTSFDKILSRDHTAPYSNHTNALNTISEIDIAATNKKRWSIFKSIIPFSSSPSNGKPGEVTPPGSPENSLEKRSSKSGTNSTAASRPGTPPYQPPSFKFCLDYLNNKPQLPTKDKKLPLPKLPTNAQEILDNLSTLERLSTESTAATEIHPMKPKPHELNGARYSGRALAEWAQVVSECRNFYIRRRREGCPKDSLIETPNLAVEAFRIFG